MVGKGAVRILLEFFLVKIAITTTNSVTTFFRKMTYYFVVRVSRNQQDEDLKIKNEDMDEEMAEGREERTQAVFAGAQPMFSMPASSQPQPDLQADAQEMDVATSDMSQTEQGEMNLVEPPPPPPVSQTEIPV